VRYGTTTNYGQTTSPPVAIGGGTEIVIVNQALSGLSPNTTYHFQFVATNANGTTSGPDATFTTGSPPAPPTTTTTTTTTTPQPTPPPPTLPPPVQNRSADVFPFVGTVLVNGVPLVAGQNIPFGSTVDTTNGTVVLQSIVNGVIQEMQFAGGVFQLLQLPNGITQLVLKGGDFSVCNATKGSKKSVRSTRAVSRADNAKTVRVLWGNGHGNFQTKGRYASATVRGTIYKVADRCDGTVTQVRQGTVAVLDLVSPDPGPARVGY
jgi:hypothetical protein